MAKAHDAVGRWVRVLVEQERDAVLKKGETPAGVAIGAAVWERVRKLASAGDATATAAINLCGQQRVVGIAGQICRGSDVAARVYQDGDVVETTMTERYAVRPRSADGTVDTSQPRQLPMWVDLSRPQLLKLIAEHQVQADKLERNSIIFGRGLMLMEAHPAATSVREACTMAGVDIEEFLLNA